MDYYRLNTAPTVDMSFCMLWDEPRELRVLRSMITTGESVQSRYPEDLAWQMAKEVPGTKLPSLIANTGNMIIVARPLREVLEACGADLECLPFALLNHKRRVASRDYCIVNPIGTFACLHTKKSEIEWDDDSGEVVGIDRMVLDAKKLQKAPALFRVEHSPTTYVLSQRLVDELRALQPVPTNVYLTKLEQA